MVLGETPMGGNCFCVAGASQSCVNIFAPLLNLAELTPNVCTSVRCAWSRPSTGSKASFAKELDFGKASTQGYVPYGRPQPPVGTLLQDLLNAGSKSGVADYFDEEKVRESTVVAPVSVKSLLQDPQDRLTSIVDGRPTVDNLIQALGVTSEEAELMQVMTIWQRNKPLWMDARHWRITASNFGKVCNQNFQVVYSSSLKKILLGDYGHQHFAAIK